jgi:hypothetical protein
MPQLPPLVNGRAYGWADITCSPGGIPATGITAIDYDQKRVKDNIYGAGDAPVARGYGKKTYSGKITLSMEEIERRRAVSPTGSLSDIPPFTIVVSYLPDGAPIVTHKLQYCEFVEDGVSAKEGDTSLPKEIELVIGAIAWK